MQLLRIGKSADLLVLNYCSKIESINSLAPWTSITDI